MVSTSDVVFNFWLELIIEEKDQFRKICMTVFHWRWSWWKEFRKVWMRSQQNLLWAGRKQQEEFPSWSSENLGGVRTFWLSTHPCQVLQFEHMKTMWTHHSFRLGIHRPWGSKDRSIFLRQRIISEYKSKTGRLSGRAKLGCGVRCGVFALICFAYSGGAAVLARKTWTHNSIEASIGWTFHAYAMPVHNGGIKQKFQVTTYKNI